MDALLPPAHPDGFRSAFGPKPPGPGDHHRVSNLCSGGPFFGCYSPFSPNTSPGFSSPSPPAAAPASRARRSTSSGSLADDGDDAAATQHRLRLARLALQYQDAANRYELCLAHLTDATAEAAALRVENAELRAANTGLAQRIAMLGGPAVALAGQLRGLRLTPMPPPAARMMPALPPPPPPQPRPVATPAEMHAALPKSISIRSAGYSKMNKRGAKCCVAKPVNFGSEKQRLFVGMDGVKPEEQQQNDKDEQLTAGLEFEVYNQGMFKTELCNKWEETGACPYGDQCQFAHGIAELRPIIRHPRYKTQLCRMVLAGGFCPYGHRCHFRHSVTPADGRLLLSP